MFRAVALGLALPCLYLQLDVDAIANGRMVLTGDASGSDHHLIATVYVGISPQARCRGRVSHAGRRARLLPLTTSSDGRAGRWRWRIPNRVPGGKWRIRLYCTNDRGAQSAGTSFRTARHRGSRKRPSRLVVPRTMIAEPWKGGGRGPGAGGGDANLYRRGECTWFVKTRRPDIPVFKGSAGDAANWAKSAEAAGFRVSRKPKAGAVAVFPPGVLGAGQYGHVAWVVWVKGGRMKVEEASFQGLRHGFRRIDWEGKNIQYIHERRARSTYVAPKTPPPGTFRYYVYRSCSEDNSCIVMTREGPGEAFDDVATIAEGVAVDIECQVVGDQVTGRDATSTNVWDRLWDGTYISDYWVSTRRKHDGFTSPIPRCGEQGPPDIELTNPPSGKTVTGIERLSANADAPGVQFAAFYADNPQVPGNATWHILGTDSTPENGFAIKWDSAKIRNQGQPRENTVRISATAVSATGEPTTAQDIARIAVSNPNADGSFTYHAYGTCAGGNCELNLRSGPGYSSYEKVGTKPEGEEVRIVCQTRGEVVSDGTSASSDIWDKLADGTWGSDFYVDTPRAGEFSPPIPQC